MDVYLLVVIDMDGEGMIENVVSCHTTRLGAQTRMYQEIISDHGNDIDYYRIVTVALEG